MPGEVHSKKVGRGTGAQGGDGVTVPGGVPELWSCGTWGHGQRRWVGAGGSEGSSPT